jgi:hypothetical protein
VGNLGTGAEGAEVDMTAVFVIDACRTPVGKIKGALASVRPDHLTADVIGALLARHPWLDPARIDDVYWGAANQAGEDNRNVARMGVLLAGLPVEVPGCAGPAWRRSPAPPGRSRPARPTSAWRAGWSR